MLRASCLAAALALVAPAARAELPPLISREVLFGNPDRVNVQIAPDGKHFAFVAPDEKNVLQVWVRSADGEDKGKPVTADKKRGIRQYFWTEDAKGLLYLQDADGDENFHVYGVDLESGNVRDYTPLQGVRAGVIALSHQHPDLVLVQLNAKSRAKMDVYRLTLSTGALELDTENPGEVNSWFADAQLHVRGAEVLHPDGSTELRVRDDAKSPWRALAKAGPDDLLSFDAFSADGKSAYIDHSIGTDKVRLIEKRLDAGGSEKVIAESEVVDIDQILWNNRAHKLEAISFVPDRRRWRALDPGVEADLAALAKLFDGDFVVTSRDAKDALWTVAYTTDRGSTRTYLWDRATKAGKLLSIAQPKLDGLSLAVDQPVTFKARDGLDLHGYLTLPQGIPQEKLPLVLLVHGGPWARDYWGFNPYAQWLANRGYAVLQINYRGSTGYGKGFMNAGNKQWGLKMHSDLLDGIDWAVKKGYADEKRVAVFGGSYGGYAALAAAAFTPDRFACNVDIVGPSNLKTLLGSIPPYWKPILGMFSRRMGSATDPDDAQLIHDASPLFKADQIKKPLLIGQGANDPRVNKAESEQIVSAIEKNGGNVTYVLYPDEGHGFRRAENSMDFNARAEEFLKACLGGRSEPLEGERVPGSTSVVRVIGGGEKKAEGGD
jgi:dipeptidyl aminopeptidase/acylaminoacyl peptidase